MKIYYTVMIFFVCLWSSGDAAQLDAETSAWIEGYLQNKMEERQIPGLSIAITVDGDIAWEKAYGIANLETGTPLTEDSIFELASITKPFTAIAVLLLVQDKAIGLHDKVSQYLEDTPDKWSDMTIFHLLTHTSGLPRRSWVSHRKNGWKMNNSTEDLYRSSIVDGMSFTPGNGFEYSDGGYTLLGMIIEKASGLSYPEFLQDRIFTPLEMLSTSVLDQRKVVRNRVRGYVFKNGEILRNRRDYELGMKSAYGILSTTRDLAKWEKSLHSRSLLNQDTMDLMFTPWTLTNWGVPDKNRIESYGLGWILEDYKGHKMQRHGGITGTEFFRVPEKGLSVILLSNLGERSEDVALSRKVVTIMESFLSRH